MKTSFNPCLYFVTDRGLSMGRPLDDIIFMAVRGGANVIQLREKDASTREFLELALMIKELLTPMEIPLIINDRIDIALASGADGVHIGQSDMPYEKARVLMGRESIIGLSVESLEQAKEANELNVDYIGLSPVFSTPTKTDISTQIGLEGIRQIKKISKHKLVAIGGLNASNAREVIEAGADSIAVVSAISSAQDPTAAAAELDSIIRNAKACE